MQKIDEVITARIDESNYQDKELLQVKVPLNMPYVINSDFERVDGQFEYQGAYYNYVKRKVSNDTLYLLCLPNKAKTALASAKSNYTKAVNDAPSSKKDASSSVKKDRLNWEYKQTFAMYLLKNDPAPVKEESSFISSRSKPVFIPSPTKPPELV